MAVLLALWMLTGCAARSVTAQSFALDTVITLTVYNGTEQDAEAALQRVDACEALLSAHRADSDIARVNAAGAQEWVEADPLTADVVSRALQLGKDSGGTLDITLLAVSELWDYKSENPQVPSGEALQKALQSSGMDRVWVEGTRILSGGAQLDLGAVAKGAIGDEVVRTLKARGVTCALASLGGNIFTLGQKSDGSPWVVAVESPFSDEYIGTLSLSGEAVVSTSSGAQRYFVRDGVTYHHILDPQSGMPARSGLASVTVVSDSGLLADGLSTALFVAGEEKAESILAACDPDAAAVLVRDDGSVRVLGDVDFTPQ